ANYLAFNSVRINEVLSRPQTGQQAIELFNQTDQTVDLSGAWLSDEIQTPKKYRFPDPVILRPGEYIVIGEGEFNPTPGNEPSFALDPINGGELFLSLADASGNLTGFRTAAKFGPSDPGISLGVYEARTGPKFVSQAASTFGNTNAAPIVGPIVISEVHYHPLDAGTNDNTVDEFIE